MGQSKDIGEKMISRSQLFCVLLLSRLSAEIVFPQTGDFSIAGFASALAAEGICFLLALPVLLYSVGGRSVYGSIKSRSKVLGIISGSVSAVILLLMSLKTALYSAEFAQRTLLGGMSGAVLFVLVALFALYSAGKGAEGIARAGALILVAGAVITLVVVVADIPHIHVRELPGAELDDVFVRQVVERMMRCGEYLAFAALLPYVRPKEDSLGCGATGFLFALASVAGTVLIMLFNIGVLGEFTASAEYPFIASAQLADIALFKRLDGFLGAIWSLAAAMRCALLLFSAYAVVRVVFERKKKTERRSI